MPPFVPTANGRLLRFGASVSSTVALSAAATLLSAESMFGLNTNGNPRLRKIMYLPRRMTNAELQTVTT